MRRTGLRPAVVAALLAVTMVVPGGGRRSPPLRPAARAHPTRTTVARHVAGSLPLSFEASGDGRFVSAGPGYSLVLTPAEAILNVAGGTLALRAAGPEANPAPELAGRQAQPGTVSRFKGADPRAWATGVATFGEVRAEQVWPGVDVVWHGDQRALEHDVVVGPGADAGAVAFEVDGAGPLTLDANGDLLVGLSTGKARLSRPVVYQDVAGARRSVPGSFNVLGPTEIGFAVGDYDHTAPLVIDPTLVTSTTLGGSSSDIGYSIAVDAAGNSYVVGTTASTDFPGASVLQAPLSPGASAPGTDAFVSKLSPDGSSVLWSTFLGAKGRTAGYAVAVGPGGSVYVAGVTESPDFPTVQAGQSTYGGGPSDAFVARLAPDGASLQWSTFLGGTQTDRARGMAIDAAGNAYVTGSTSSVNFPAVNAEQSRVPRPDDIDAFLTEIPADGGPFVYSTRLGGSNDDHGLAVAVDSVGAAYVTGDTLSAGFPTVRALQPASGGSASGVAGSFPDAFVAKFTPAGSALVYSTFLGGSDSDQGTAIAVDSSGAAYVTGITSSPDFPVVGPIQARKGGDSDAFVAKIDPAGAALVYSTYLGGDGADDANGIAVDHNGNAAIIGTTSSANWPTVSPTQPARSSGDDAFVAELSPGGARILFSTYLGGRDSDAGLGVAIDTHGTVHMVGVTSSPDFPQLKPLRSARPVAGGDAFVATISVDQIGPAPRSAAAPLASPHRRRLQALGALALGLLLAAGAQTVYLCRPKSPRSSQLTTRAGVPAGGNPVVEVHSRRVLPGAKSGAASTGVGRSASTSATRTGAGMAAGTRPGPGGADGAMSAALGDGGGEPTPPTSAGTPERRTRGLDVAQLLTEDMWARGSAPVPGDPTVDAGQAEASRDSSGARPLRTGERRPPVQGSATTPRGPGAEPVPPVLAEGRSFWDLFPEDLPQPGSVALPASGFLVDPIALPDGPDSVAARVAREGVPLPPTGQPAPFQLPGPPGGSGSDDAGAPSSLPDRQR
ncbi:MAG: SBBP repeat-containing protein [Actinomycetota bacterium]|nr:SBBP repeat-containing protein [Actinomycetota bacterium]